MAPVRSGSKGTVISILVPAAMAGFFIRVPSGFAMKIFIILLIIGCLSLSGCATPKEIETLSVRISSLEQRNRELDAKNEQLRYRIEDHSKVREQKERNLRSQSAELDVKLDQFRSDVQQLLGEFESKTYTLNKELEALGSELRRVKGTQRQTREAIADIQTQIDETKQKIARTETYLNFEAASKGASTATPSGGGETVEPIRVDTPEEIYKQAKQAFDNGDFESAREGFIQLLTDFPTDDQADNSQFWIGESYYREKWYEKAILEYQKVIENYPTGNKVQASLLKQGFSFFNLGDRANSRLILKELISKYPDSNEARIAETKLKGIEP